MRIDHVALWTRDLEPMRAFYMEYFGAASGPRYASATRAGFESYFLAFHDGGRLELMTIPELADRTPGSYVGWAHLALSVGSREAVDALADRMAAEGIRIVSAPRVTGDGYYEAVARDPDGNLVEITA